MKRLSIACDIDGVLFDFCTPLCFKLRELGIEVFPEDIKHWDLRKALGIAGPVAERIARAPKFSWRVQSTFAGRIFYNSLVHDGHEVVALTAPMKGSPDWLQVRNQALVDIGFKPEDIVFCAGGHKARFRADVLIEDHPANAKAWCEANPEGRAFIIDRPWNRYGADCWAEHPNLFFTTLDHLPEYIRILAGKEEYAAT